MGLFEVLFDDKCYFYLFSVINLNVEYLCGDDNYVVCYDFSMWFVWCLIWKVIGFCKDYIMISKYSFV